jgi:hypothetical protein
MGASRSAFLDCLADLLRIPGGMAAMGVVDVAIVKIIGWARFSRFVFAASLIAYVAVASIVSWFGAAIPLVLRGNISVWTALRKSLEASDGYQGFLFLLVIESLVGSYLAWSVAHYVLLLMLPGSNRRCSSDSRC